MTKRTIQFYGQGLGSGTAEITVTFQGQTVYSGPVPTAPTILAPNNQYLLFSVSTLEVADQGSFPVTVTPTVEDVNMTYVLANYTRIINPIFTPEQWEIITDPSKQDETKEIISSLANPLFSEAEQEVLDNPETPQSEKDAILAAHAVSYTVSTGADGFSDNFWEGDSRTNVTINGEALPYPPVPRPENFQGDWPYPVPNNQTMTFDLNLEAGIE